MHPSTIDWPWIGHEAARFLMRKFQEGMTEEDALSEALDLYGVVCGRGRNPTLRLWPAIFSGEIDVFPSERRDMGQEIGR